MKKKLVKQISVITGFLLGTGLFLIGMQTTVLAAGSVTITADKNSASISDTVTFHVETSEPEDPATIPEITVTYDPNVLTFTNCDVEYGGGGGGLITLNGQSANLSFTVATTGEATVSAEAIIDDDGNNPATAAASLTVGASAQGGLSSDATLRMLSISPGEMSPAFSPEVTDYKIRVEESVTDITVSGGVTNDNAQITAASGFKDLKVGTNQAVITVTAEDGSTLTYRFTITRGEKEQEEEIDEAETETEEEDMQTETVMGEGMLVTVDEVSYTVQTTISDDMLPDGCSKTTATFNGEEVEAALFDAGGLILLYAVPDGGESGDFFIYNQNDGNLQIFVQLRSIENRFIVPIEPEESAPAAFSEEKLQWNNSYIPAYKLTDASVKDVDLFYLVYAISNEGERGFYLYDTLEGTYQRFLNYTGTGTLAETDSSDMKNIVIIGALIVVLVVLIMVIVNLIIRNRDLTADLTEVAGTSEKPEKKPRKPKQKEPKQKETKQQEAKRKVVKQKEAKQREPKQEEIKSKPEIKSKAEKKVILPQETPLQPSEVIRTNTTGRIPITVVQPPKTGTEVKRAQVPIYTLEKQPVQLTREAPPDQLDDDFEFEFINFHNE